MTDDPIRFDGLDDAILGVGTQADGRETFVYSALRITQQLGKTMPVEDALDWLFSNISCAYLGETTPVILWDFDHDD